MPPCNLRVAITIGDYLALLGHLDTPLHRISWRRQNRLIGRAAPAPDTAPASVKQFQPDALLSGQTRQGLLRSVQAPVRSQIPTILVAVRVANHDLFQLVPFSTDLFI